MSLSRDEVLSEFAILYPALAGRAEFEPLFADCTRVSQLLGNGPVSVDPLLEVLEAALEDRLPLKRSLPVVGKKQPDIKGAQQYFADWKERRESPAKMERSDFSHLLAGELSRVETENGFDVLPDGKVKVYMIVLPGETFRQEATQRMQFKDLIDARHGEYTHRIQWYLAIRQGGLSTRPVAKLFYLVNSIPNLWAHMFDRLLSTRSASNHVANASYFRCPEYLNDYLTGDDALRKFPVLSSFLRHRKEKRIGTFDPREYFARKKYGMSCRDMDEATYKDLVQHVLKVGTHRYENLRQF